jgi:hypothetical protein
MRWTSQPADPLHFWIGLVPRSWPVGEGLWVDLARGGLGSAAKVRNEIPERWTGEPPAEVVYLPSVPEDLESRRSGLVGSLVDIGAPVLVQAEAGTVPKVDPRWVVFDPLEALLVGNTGVLRDLPSGSRVVWPLIAGLTDDREQWEEGLAALASAGVKHVQPLALALDPASKRRLVERTGDETFDLLFHGAPPSEREFSSLAAERGFGPFLSRPLPTKGASRENQKLAEQLAMAGELWLRVGRSESGGQNLYRSARWVDRESHDLSTLCREGNLGVFPWLDSTSSQVITEFVTAGTASLVQELEREYLGRSRA